MHTCVWYQKSFLRRSIDYIVSTEIKLKDDFRESGSLKFIDKKLLVFFQRKSNFKSKPEIEFLFLFFS